jgi:hypothetical protein
MAAQGIPRPVFVLWDAAPAGPDQDLLGLWSPVSLPGAAGTEYGAPDEESDATPIWRASYPADPGLVQAALANAHQELAAADAALAAAPARLDAFVLQKQFGPAYSAPAPDAYPARPEGDLDRLLGDAWQGATGVSYAAGDQLPGGWGEAFEAFQSFVERLRRTVAHFALVETDVEGRLVGRTKVTWTGDVDTRLAEWVDPGHMHLHQQTLELALSSRRTMLRTTALIIANAVKLSGLLTMPGGVALAPLAVLRFINELRKEMRKHQELANQRREM